MSTETKLDTPQHTLKRWARLDHRRGSLVDPLSGRVPTSAQVKELLAPLVG
jgi:hypothetical protein